jgi:purine-nucleoside phosphorylase
LTDKSKLDKAVSYISSRITQGPSVAVVLGSGLGAFAEHIVDPVEISTSSIPSYPISTVAGHEGKLVFGKIRNSASESLPLLVFKGRVHFYETGDLSAATFPVAVAHALGARYLLATNAAGGMNPEFSEGDLMLIDDFINFSFLNPHLTHHEYATTLFKTGAPAYFDQALSDTIVKAAHSLEIQLRRGSYCWLKGPSYETKAEIEMLRRLGVDAVGMSTVPEIVLASELGMKAAAISLISNMAAGLSIGRLSHKEVAQTADRVKKVFISLLETSILQIKN